MSASEAAPNASALFIWSYVVPAAPFIVMPSAMEALRGEAKMFESLLAAESFLKRANEKSFVEVTRAFSAVVSWRGRASSATG